MLLLTVGQAAADRAILSGLGDTPAGALMVEALHHRFDDPLGGARPTIRARAEPEAWDALRVFALARSTTEPGATDGARKIALAYRRLGMKLTRDLDRLAAHPGYVGRSALGIATTEMPARRKVGDVRWWPTVSMAAASPNGDPNCYEVAVLKPEVFRVRTRVFTTWKPEPLRLVEVR